MSDTKWTPGPWKATRSNPNEGADVWWITGNFSERGNCETDIGTVSAGVKPVEISSANAYLIAAAPDLYEALEAVLKMLPIGFATTERPGDADERNTTLNTIRNKAIEALARARGEQP